MPTTQLTLSDIERYAAQFGDSWPAKVGVLLVVVERLMSSERKDMADELRKWAGGKTPNETNGG